MMKGVAIQMDGPQFLGLLLGMIGGGQVTKLADDFEHNSEPVNDVYQGEKDAVVRFLREIDKTRPLALAILERGQKLNKEIRNAPKN